MGRQKLYRLASLLVMLGVPLMLTHTAFAADGSIGQVENFIRSVIKVLAGLAGLIATGFFVAGGLTYIVSTGNPDKMEKAKKTLQWAAVGLAICAGAFVLSNIVTELATKAFGS